MTREPTDGPGSTSTAADMPYCDHTECHDPRTRLYTEGAATGTSATDWSQVKPGKLILLGSSSDLPGFRRWCMVHALMFEGCA